MSRCTYLSDITDDSHSQPQNKGGKCHIFLTLRQEILKNPDLTLSPSTLSSLTLSPIPPSTRATIIEKHCTRYRLASYIFRHQFWRAHPITQRFERGSTATPASRDLAI